MMNAESDYEEQPLIPSQDEAVPESTALHISHEEPVLSSRTSGENEDNKTDDSSTNSEGRTKTTAVPATAHSYLPGTSHPLLPESFLDRRHRIRSNSITRDSSAGTNKRFRDDYSGAVRENEARSSLVSPCHKATQTVELPILELNGVVLFPGSTIPVRLRERHWIEYLGRQIDEARGIRGFGSGSEEVRLGILTYVDPRPAREQHLRRQRRSWMHNAISPSQGSQITMFLREYALTSHELDESDSGTGQGSASQPQGSSTSTTDTRRVNPPRSRRVRPGRRASQSPRLNPEDKWIGRIGTMATITCTHEDAAGSAVETHATRHDQRSLVWQRSEDSQLVVTALGTGRFRIVSCIDDDSSGSGRQYRNGFEGDMASVRLYEVEELEDDEILLPPVSYRKPLSSAGRNPVSGPVPYLLRQEQIIHSMSLVTQLPHFVYRNYWPWRLVGLIRIALDRIPGLKGLRRSLPNFDSLGTNGTLAISMSKPRRFSFWMACNMPLSEGEKLELLEMHCTVKRLRLIYEKVLEQEQHETFVYCKNCSQRLSSTSSVFTVGGADGTTGAYVNEHGIVHQTVTLRAVNQRSVFLSGGAETKDSWFPGYSWTIAYCATCRSHLGWKFLRVSPNRESSSSSPEEMEDRPGIFWGMSGASVTTEAFAGVDAY